MPRQCSSLKPLHDKIEMCKGDIDDVPAALLGSRPPRDHQSGSSLGLTSVSGLQCQVRQCARHDSCDLICFSVMKLADLAELKTIHEYPSSEKTYGSFTSPATVHPNCLRQIVSGFCTIWGEASFP